MPLRLAENAVPVARLTGDRRIAEGAFRLPALLLAMSRRPDDFRGEILGADLCLRSVGLLPALAVVRRELPTGTDWAAVDPAEGRGREEAPLSRAVPCRCGGTAGAGGRPGRRRGARGLRLGAGRPARLVRRAPRGTGGGRGPRVRHGGADASAVA
ncbi:hypothetical protein LUW77_12880 [Streptomyces radiopugnans]|nr:hypothetical protein LUW77_12880 [Streptomyces radiopugnans]